MPWQRRARRSPQPPKDDPQGAFQYGVELLSRQDQSSNALYERLCRRYTGRSAAGAVARLVELDYLNDTRYARGRARALYSRHKSRQGIRAALLEKGVPAPLAAQTLEELYGEWAEELAERDVETLSAPDPELAAACALAERNRRLAEGRDDLVLAALQRRGFSWRTAREAVRCAKEALAAQAQGEVAAEEALFAE